MYATHNRRVKTDKRFDIYRRFTEATLSGGQVQGLVMLRALLLSPAYVLCRL